MERLNFQAGNSKLRMTGYRWLLFLQTYPVRLRRIVLLFRQGIAQLRLISLNTKGLLAWVRAVTFWWMRLFFATIDLFGIPEIYETLRQFIKFKTRKLTEKEVRIAKTVFADSIDLAAVSVDERAFLGCKRGHLLYVSFHTINAWGTFGPELLVHELVHVWQYEQLGSQYIPLAWQAQSSRNGYDYGGSDALRNFIEEGKPFRSFNLEQQAEIVTDYFKIMKGKKPGWGNAGKSDLPVYLHFVDEISNKK